jgi:hypothetical protein
MAREEGRQRARRLREVDDADDDEDDPEDYGKRHEPFPVGSHELRFT